MRASRRHLILVPCAALAVLSVPPAASNETLKAAAESTPVTLLALQAPQTFPVASTTTAPPTTAAPTTTTAPPPPPTTVPPPPPTTAPPTTAPPPPPEPEPAPEPPAPQGDIESLIYEVFGDAGAKAVQVARCESGLNPGAVNGQYRGLFQLGNYHVDRAARLGYSWDQMFQAYPNIVVAHDLFMEQGWRPWACA